MGRYINRRHFAKAGALATFGITSFHAGHAAGSPQPGKLRPLVPEQSVLDVRPYQLMCVVCRLGDGCTEDLGDPRLTELLTLVRETPHIPIRLRCNTESVYGFMNPGPGEDSPEGKLFNTKRDLDILQKLGLVPGAIRPATDVFERLLTNIATPEGICGYGTVAAEVWRGCDRASSGAYEKAHASGIDAIIPPRDEREKAQAKKTSVAAIYQAETLRIRPHHLMCMSCFYGGRLEELAPIKEDNLFEAIDAIHKTPEVPVTLIAGCCMICPPCSRYDPETNLCVGGRSMALRDQKKDLDVLQKLGLKYGDSLPARTLYQRLFDRIPSTRDICGYGDGEQRAPEWSVCGDPAGREAYRKARAANLGIKG